MNTSMLFSGSRKYVIFKINFLEKDLLQLLLEMVSFSQEQAVRQEPEMFFNRELRIFYGTASLHCTVIHLHCQKDRVFLAAILVKRNSWISLFGIFFFFLFIKLLIPSVIFFFSPHFQNHGI